MHTYTNWLYKIRRLDAKRSLDYWAMQYDRHPNRWRRFLHGVPSLQGFYRIVLLSHHTGNYVFAAYPIGGQAKDQDCPEFKLDKVGRLSSAPKC